MLSKDVRLHVDKIINSVSSNKNHKELNIPTTIRYSWERSLEKHSIDPGKDEPVRILTAKELKEYTDPIDKFLRIAKVGMLHLYRQVEALGYSTLLCDANGITVDWRGNESLADQWKAAGLYLGAVWSENQEGTCAVGTALIEQKPLIVHRGEHFRVKNSTLTCSCSPIIGPTGKMMALIDVSSLQSPENRESQHLALQLVMKAARMIESAYFLDHFKDQWIIGLSHEREFADVTSECYIAVSGEGQILAADWVASQALARDRHTALIGQKIGGIFDLDFNKLVEMTYNSSLVLPIHTQQGKQKLYASVRHPRALSIKAQPQTTRGQHNRIRQQNLYPQFDLDRLAGRDPLLQKNVRKIKRIMDHSIPILLTGETGTGKEMFARAIHMSSRRSERPFIAVNCAAIPESLIESELFGYKKGAFTGADKKGMRGKIQQADGGTLFLDEIGDMPPNLQTRLLRVLAEREVTPLGAETSILIDVHVICATHQNLIDLVHSGHFREDLYYRLNGVSFDLPPLRIRADINYIISQILEIESQGTQGTIKIDQKTMALLTNYPWPGNIRQLRNCLRYALAVCENGVITPEDLPAEIVSSGHHLKQKSNHRSSINSDIQASSGDPDLDDDLHSLNIHEQQERKKIIQALAQHHWQISKALQEIGLSRATVYRKMSKYQIVPPNRRD
ncbi:MAG: sigma-54-dependent Fis family transcriptional regulator [Desulfuromonadales bacterium]|nr:sigma-54-dependent Fis family transcriptional regulator [Desulfuromonadales bacterium]